MVFSSTLFIFLFLPITLALYLLFFKFCKVTAANVILLLASMLFYAWGGVKYFLVLSAVILVNWKLTLWMNEKPAARKALFITILVVDLGNLFFFKYFNFFVDNIRAVGSIFGYDILRNVAEVALPIGISFYTFQIISYVADVYVGRVKPQRSLIKLALYVMMFPQLIAGPIVRYKDIANEIDTRTITLDEAEYGIRRFITGFAKKVIVANTMGSMADAVFAMTGTVNTLYAWLGTICYTLQIYYDFSAYSDMAIGIGRILGFHFVENFNLPYCSQSIREFWKRWHISLSSWFQDYVYIPLGGSRKGEIRTYFNLIVVFLLTGFWHGAAWQFIVWGLYHGAFLILERVWLNKVLDKLPAVIRHVYTLLVVVVGWVFFRADNLPLAWAYIKNMFVLNLSGLKDFEILLQFNSLFWVCLLIGMIFSVTRFEKWKNAREISDTVIRFGYLFLWGISVLYLSGLSYNPFIYFKF